LSIPQIANNAFWIKPIEPVAESLVEYLVLLFVDNTTDFLEIGFYVVGMDFLKS